MAGGSETVEQRAAVAGRGHDLDSRRADALHDRLQDGRIRAPFTRGQPHELLTTSGAIEGSGFWLERSVGAMNHWRHSM